MRRLAAWLVALAIAAGAGPAAAQAPSATGADVLDPGLRALVARPPAGPQTTGPLRIDDAGRVQVVVRADDPGRPLLDRIVDLGGAIDRVRRGLVQAWVPVGALEALAAFPGVRTIAPPRYGRPGVGSRTTEGDAVLRIGDARQAWGLSGRGVSIGVISDGVDRLSASVSTNDLPATLFHCRMGLGGIRPPQAAPCAPGETLVETSGGVIGRSFRADSNLAPAGASEGVAMLEIVRDLAPEAELWFANGQTPLDIEEAWDHLADHVDVIVSDIHFFGYFPDGASDHTAAIAAIVAGPGRRARAYVHSVGNWADAHYTGVYESSGSGDFYGKYHRFRRTDETVGPSTPLNSNRVAVVAGGTLAVELTWDDPPGASRNDYDLLLFDCSRGFLAFPPLAESTNPQNGSQDAWERIEWTNGGVLADVCYAIQNVGDRASPRTLNVLIDGEFIEQEFYTEARSLASPADAAGDMIAVGAVPWDDPDTIEFFSSRGPTFDGRPKPDVVATDRVAVSDAWGYGPFFAGTSAAAPHVAGLAALLLELNPALTRSQLKTALMQSAVPLGDANTYGTGRIDGLAAAVATAPPSPALAAAVLPASRSVQVGSPATAFASIVNAGPGTATGCGIVPITGVPASFTWQQTDAANQPVGAPGALVDIPEGPQGQSFVFSFAPTAAFGPTDVQLAFDCTNTEPALIEPGVNTLLLSASAGPVPDIVAVALTPSGDGVVAVPGPPGTGVFVVATANLGAGGSLTASADTGAASLPLTLALCETNPGTSACLAPPAPSVATTIAAGATATFGVFVGASGPVPFAPGTNRVFVRFTDGGIVRGATSVAVRSP